MFRELLLIMVLAWWGLSVLIVLLMVSVWIKAQPLPKEMLLS